MGIGFYIVVYRRKVLNLSQKVLNVSAKCLILVLKCLILKVSRSFHVSHTKRLLRGGNFDGNFAKLRLSFESKLTRKFRPGSFFSIVGGWHGPLFRGTEL